MIKAKLYAIAAAIGAGLLIALKFTLTLLGREREKNEALDAQLRFKSDVENKDREIENTYSDLKREADKDLKNDEIPEHLRNPRA